MAIKCPKCGTINKNTVTRCYNPKCEYDFSSTTEQATQVTVVKTKDDMLKKSVDTTTLTPNIHSQGLGYDIPTKIKLDDIPTKIKPGKPTKISYKYRLILIVSIVAGILDASDEPYLRDPWDAFVSSSIIFGIITAIAFHLITLWFSRYSTIGIVTNLNSIAGFFDLRLTDKEGIPLKDKNKFLIQTIKVAFDSHKVHGSSIQEGSLVVLKGKYVYDNIEAKEIWNCSPEIAEPVLSKQVVYRGRVTNRQLAQSQDLRYPGQGRFLEVLSFSLQLTDEEFKELLREEKRDLLPPLPVEIRAQNISGRLENNDKVEVIGQLVNGVLYTKAVHNYSVNGTMLVVKGWAPVS